MSLLSEVKVYQFRVYLREISPMIWRRLLLRGDHTIADLHYVIQIAMGWDDFHLYHFGDYQKVGATPRNQDMNQEFAYGNLSRNLSILK